MIRVLAIVCMLSGSALAAPPPGATGEHSAWFARQTNQRGGSCCDHSDGHKLGPDEWRAVGGRYEVMLDGQWRAIELWMMRRNPDDPNPTGGAVLWHRGAAAIYCFAPGTVF